MPVPRLTRRPPSARPRHGAVLLLALGCLAAVGAAVGPAAPVSAAAPAGTLGGPGGLSLVTSPADLSTVQAGDRVHMVFSGLDSSEYVDFVGNCPSPLPVPAGSLTQSFGLGLACFASFDSGLPGAIDATTGANLAVSTQVTRAGGLFPDRAGTVTVDFLVGTGKSLGAYAYILFGNDGSRRQVDSLTCDAKNPCAIGFAVKSLRSPDPVWSDLEKLVIRPAAFATNTTGCRPGDDSSVPGVGPDRGLVVLSALNRAACQASPSPLPVDYVGSGEQSVGDVGTSTDFALAGSSLLRAPDAPTPSAPRVLVPVGLTAAVLAEVGGPAKPPSLVPGQVAYSTDPLPALSLTASDAARIVLHDYPIAQSPLDVSAKDNTLGAGLRRRNAVLQGFDASLFGAPLNYAPTVTYPYGQDSAPAALSGYLAAAAADSWRYPKQPPNADAKRVGTPVGVTSSFAPLVDPGSATDVKGTPRLTAAVSAVGSLYSVLFGKDIANGVDFSCPAFPPPTAEVVPTVLARGCLRFLAGDSVTMSSLRLPQAKIQNASGAFVAPTAQALQAAVGGATPDANGVLALPTPYGDAYPMTYVEYAVVPAAPLLTADCLPRTAQQDRLRGFLTYAVGAGQAALPPGMAPLTPALQKLALAEIAKVGTAAVTGPCAPSAGGGAGSGGGGGGAGGGGGGGGGGGTPSASLLPFPSGPGAGVPGALAAGVDPVAASPASAAAAAKQVDAAVPRFAGVPTSGGVAMPLVGLALLVAALSAAGLASAGHLPAAAALLRPALLRPARLWPALLRPARLRRGGGTP